MVITKDDLLRWGACVTGPDYLDRHFPDGAEVSVEVFDRMSQAGIPHFWLVSALPPEGQSELTMAAMDRCYPGDVPAPLLPLLLTTFNHAHASDELHAAVNKKVSFGLKWSVGAEATSQLLHKLRKLVAGEANRQNRDLVAILEKYSSRIGNE